MIHRSRYPDPVIPAVDVTAYVLQHAEDFGERAALVDGITGEEVSYRDLVTKVGAGGASLTGAGVGTGDAVALMSPNRPDWAVAFYAVLAAGGAVVPVNPALTEAEIVRQLRLSGASMLITDPSVADKARQAAGAVGIAVLDVTGLSTSAPAASGTAGAGPRPGSTAVIAYSSGTTGQPKGVVLTHRNLVAAMVQHEGIYHVAGDDVVLAALPLFHIYGMSIVLDYALRHGATVVTMPRFSPERYLGLIAERAVTWLHIAPPIALLLGSPQAAGTDFSRVRHAVSGAAPLDAVVSRLAADRLGCPIGQGYGMTEASPGVTWVPDDGTVECRPGTVGVLVAGTEARIVDPATGEDTDGPGELWVRGPQVMAGYLDDPHATAATLVEDGWLRTGDIVTVDNDGVWSVVDRLKELIKYKGYQVPPAELEALLLQHPAVSDVAVIGLPDVAAGEIPAAYVVTETPVAGDDLLAWVAQRVAPYKKIRAVEFVDAIPKSASGKILRRQLKERAVADAGPRSSGSP
jgi:acyl-CoA synthetase (AMP-forming)/AMP-acid ligase II